VELKLQHPELSSNLQTKPFAEIVSYISEHPEQFAHYLAMTNPNLATELLEELLIWRKSGRI